MRQLMKTIQEFIIGSAVFLMIDRAARILSARMAPDKVLQVELMTLGFVILIAWKVFA